MTAVSAHELGSDSQGFTVVELVVVITLSMLFSGLVLNFALDYWGSVTTLQSSNETLVSRQNAGDTLRYNLNRATGLIGQNSIADTNTAVADPSQPSGSYWEILHAVPQTIALPSSGSSATVFYFTAPSVDTNHNQIMNGLQPYYDEFILYLDGTSKQLLLRTLANPSASGNQLQTTCPKTLATGSCPADRIVATDIYSVGLNYFSRSGNQVNYQSIIDPDTGSYIGPDFPAAEVIEVTLNLKKPAVINGRNDTTNATIIRVALRNG